MRKRRPSARHGPGWLSSSDRARRHRESWQLVVLVLASIGVVCQDCVRVSPRTRCGAGVHDDRLDSRHLVEQLVLDLMGDVMGGRQ